MPHVESRRVPNLLSEYLTYHFLSYGQAFYVGGEYAVVIVEGDENDELKLINDCGRIVGIKQMTPKERADFALSLSYVTIMRQPLERAIDCPACNRHARMQLNKDVGGWYMSCPCCGIQTAREESPQLAMKAAVKIQEIITAQLP